MSHKKSFGLVAGVLLFSFEAAFPHQPLFGPPQNLGPKINSVGGEIDPFLSADGKKLFFAAYNRPGGYGQEDIWFAEMTDTGWTTPRALGPQINSGARQKSPSVSPDGQKLYYVDAERGGYDWDIWVSNWDSSLKDWGTPQNLGPPVNTIGTEFSAHLGPDGRHLYFSSYLYIPDSITRCGFYMSEWNGTGWSDPVKLAPNLHFCSNGGEYPSLTADSSWLYFDNFVTDGESIFSSYWNGLLWEAPIDLRPQVGGRAISPSVAPSGDSLLFSGSIDLGGFGDQDIYLMTRLVPGDLNLDGQLTAADVVLEVNAVFLSEAFPAPLRSADGNCDGQLSPADVVLNLNATFLGLSLPCWI